MKMRLNYPVYPELYIRAGGCLPDDKRACATWYYYTLAQQLYEKIGGLDTHLKGGTIEEAQFGVLEGDPWLDAQYERIARSVAIVYGLKDPGEFMTEGFWDCVKAQAHQLKLPVPKEEYMRPLRIVLLH